MREGHPPSGRIREVPKSPVAAPKARHTRKSRLFKFGWHHEVFRYSRPNARDGSIFLFGEFHRDTGRPFRGVRRGRLSTSPRRCEPFLRKSNANPQLPLGRCGHRPYAKSGEFLKRRRGGRLCPPGGVYWFYRNSQRIHMHQQYRMLEDAKRNTAAPRPHQSAPKTASLQFVPMGRSTLRKIIGSSITSCA